MFQAWGFAFNQTTVRNTEKLTTTCALSFPFMCLVANTRSLYCDRHLGCFSWATTADLGLDEVQKPVQSQTDSTLSPRLFLGHQGGHRDFVVPKQPFLAILHFPSWMLCTQVELPALRISLSHEERQSIASLRAAILHFPKPLCGEVGYKVLGIDMSYQWNSGDQEVTYLFILEVPGLPFSTQGASLIA